MVGTLAAAALAAGVFDAEAKGGGGKGGGRGGKSGGHASGNHGHQHHHHGHGGGFRSGTLFVGASFVAWPRAYYWPDYHPGAQPEVEYWYYCQPYAAYYPYVQECPMEWQPVLPSAPSPEG